MTDAVSIATNQTRAELPAGLADAEVYVEAAQRPIAGGKWHILPDDTVLYERRPGTYEPAVVAASTLRTSPTWKQLLAS